MAGETLKTTGIVLDIRPWSRTSHVVTWLTPDRGPVVTLVKGAVRPKSAFLGQYDFFYTCELVYYIRAKGELHAIREAAPLNPREHLRGSFRDPGIVWQKVVRLHFCIRIRDWGFDQRTTGKYV